MSIFFLIKREMVNVMIEILHGFSLGMSSDIYQLSEFVFLQVMLNFELGVNEY